LEFKILRLFIKNKCWLTSRTIQNTTSKHKNFTILLPILREREAEKTRSGRWNSKFWGYLWRKSDGSHPEPHKHDFETYKFQHFSSYPQRKWCWENAFRTLEFKILRLFMNKKWWLTSRTAQNTTSKYKNSTIFPLILREKRCWENAFSASENAENYLFFQDVGIQNFKVIYEK
jgi:hypothetical protein